MDKDLLIHQFLDGESNSADEAELFDLLASSDEAKLMFKKQLAVKTAIKNDTAAFTAPASSTANIFSELGIASALGAGVAAASTSGSWFSNLWSGYSQALLTFFGTAIAAVVVILSLDFGDSQNTTTSEVSSQNSSESNNISENVNFNSNSNISSPSGNDNKIIKYLFSNDLEKLSGIEKANAEKYLSKLNSLKKELLSAKFENKSLRQDLQTLNEELKNIVKVSEFSNKQNMESNSNNFFKESINHSIDFSSLDSKDFEYSNGGQNESIIQIPENISTSNPIINMNTGLNLPYNVELTMLNDYSLSNTNNELTGNSLDNLRLELSLNSTKNWAFGLDFRNENFYQKYNYIVDGQPYIFEQNPNFWVFSGMLKYSPDFLEGDVLGIDQKGFAQLSLGAGTPGPVGRLMLGTQFYLAGNFYLKTGIEYSYLNYVQNDLNYQSDKISLQIGIGFSNR